MAKQLYDYWFVQFDFPNEEDKPYKSSGGAMVWNEKLKREIPEGWKVANVFDELSVQYGFPFSTELFTEEPTNIPVVRIRDILENSVSAYSEEEVDEKYKLQKQDLLVGMDGNFHMNYWNDNVSYLNQRSVRLRAKSKSAVSIMQAKYDIAPYIKAKELRAKGSTVGHLSDKDLKELFVLVSPNVDFRNKFNSILAEIIENRCEMIELTKQRDELLPLLMNGQASVNYHLSVIIRCGTREIIDISRKQSINRYNWPYLHVHQECPKGPPTEQTDATVAKGCGLFNQNHLLLWHKIFFRPVKGSTVFLRVRSAWRFVFISSMPTGCWATLTSGRTSTVSISFPSA